MLEATTTTKRKRTAQSISIPSTLHKRIKEYTDDRGMKLTFFACQALEKHLKAVTK